MKKSIMVFTALVGMVFSANAFAYCPVWNAKIAQVFQKWDYIFVKFDRDTYCPCIDKRLMFYKKEDGKIFLTAAVLNALKHNRSVYAWSNRSTCSFWGYAAKLDTLILKK